MLKSEGWGIEGIVIRKGVFLSGFILSAHCFLFVKIIIYSGLVHVYNIYLPSTCYIRESGQ